MITKLQKIVALEIGIFGILSEKILFFCKTDDFMPVN